MKTFAESTVLDLLDFIHERIQINVDKENSGKKWCGDYPNYDYPDMTNKELLRLFIKTSQGNKTDKG